MEWNRPPIIGELSLWQIMVLSGLGCAAIAAMLLGFVTAFRWLLGV